MKKTTLTVMLAVSSYLLPLAQSTGLSPLASELFRNTKSKLTVAEKNQIATSTGFVLSGNKIEPFALDKDSKDYPFMAGCYPTDLNKDGKEEIFIVFGNGFTSGNTGSSVSAYIKNNKGVFENHFGFPGVMPDVLTASSQGYPDLVVGGPGMEYPVFRWNGKTYGGSKSISDNDYSKIKKSSIGEVSKLYQSTLQ